MSGHNTPPKEFKPLIPLFPLRQASFNLFGMELLAGLDVANTADFFTTFFRLPSYLWQSFLANKLSSTELLGFALTTFALAPPNIKVQRLLLLWGPHLCRGGGGAAFAAYRATCLDGLRGAGLQLPGCSGVLPCMLLCLLKGKAALAPVSPRPAHSFSSPSVGFSIQLQRSVQSPWPLF
jgi:hypothetical protein